MNDKLHTAEARYKAEQTRRKKKELREKGLLPTPMAAIRAKCKDCIYDEKNVGTWRQQVQGCTSTDCPLYPLRPLSQSK